MAKRVEQLELYFNLSREKTMIEDCKLMADKPYSEKVIRLNELTLQLRQLQKEL